MALQDNKWSHVYNRMLSDRSVNTREYLDSLGQTSINMGTTMSTYFDVDFGVDIQRTVVKHSLGY